MISLISSDEVNKFLTDNQLLSASPIDPFSCFPDFSKKNRKSVTFFEQIHAQMFNILESTDEAIGQDSVSFKLANFLFDKSKTLSHEMYAFYAFVAAYFLKYSAAKKGSFSVESLVSYLQEMMKKVEISVELLQVTVSDMANSIRD